jgi:hypothetical protein
MPDVTLYELPPPRELEPPDELDLEPPDEPLELDLELPELDLELPEFEPPVPPVEPPELLELEPLELEPLELVLELELLVLLEVEPPDEPLELEPLELELELDLEPPAEYLLLPIIIHKRYDIYYFFKTK